MAVFGILSLQILVPRQFAEICPSINMEWGVIVSTVVENAISNFQTLKKTENFMYVHLLGK
jgi:hypothetical protein